MLVSLAVAGWGFAIAALATALVLRARLELVAGAEHELRGPLTVLGLACEQLRCEPTGRRHAELLEPQLARLRSGLADLTAARQGRRSRDRPVPVELEGFARSALAGWRPALRRAGRGARVDWPAGRVEVVADRGRLAQALGNLLANAAEHGAGPLELRGRRLEGAVRVEVRNAARPRSVKRPLEVTSAKSAPELGSASRPRGERGRGLGIAARAAASAGGRLELERDGGEVVAALELPVTEGAASAERGGRPRRREKAEGAGDDRADVAAAEHRAGPAPAPRGAAPPPGGGSIPDAA
jgi:hypothetical protein